MFIFSIIDSNVNVFDFVCYNLGHQAKLYFYIIYKLLQQLKATECFR